MFMSKVLVVYYYCADHKEWWDIICMRDDTCWCLTPSSSSGPQAQLRPLVPQKEWNQLWYRPACWCPRLVAVVGEVWGWEQSPVLFIGTVTGSSPAHVSSPWLACGIFYLMTNKMVGWLICQTKLMASIRPWTWFQNTGKKQFSDSDKLWGIY